MEKNHYLVCVVSVLLTTFSFLPKAYTQQMAYLNSNNINPGIGVGGVLFWMIPDSLVKTIDGADTVLKIAQFESPKNSGVSNIFSATMWMSGLNQGNLHAASDMYGAVYPGYKDGPIGILIDTSYIKYFKKVFKVSQDELNQFKSLQPPITINNISPSILYWPAKGNQHVAAMQKVTINQRLAPFVDLNFNGLYEPTLGEYPRFCGDECIFFVFNDMHNTQQLNNVPVRLNVEVRALAEVYYLQSEAIAKHAINNTLFLNVEIENKSNLNYSDFLYGIFEDPDLGCFNNDRSGCDTVKQLMFAYNGTVDDFQCQGVLGNSPYRLAQGTMYLNESLHAFVSSYNSTINMPVYISGEPQNVYHTLNGLTQNGTPFTYGGIGYGGTIPTRFMFSGNPNDTSEWSEVHPSVFVSLPAGDRRFIGSTYIGSFAPGETKSIDLAFFVSYDSTATHISIVDTLKRDAAIIQQFYDDVVVPCRAQNATGLSENEMMMQAHIYPNPTKGSISIKCNALLRKVVMHNLLAQEVFAADVNTYETTLYLPNLSKGVYVLYLYGSTATTTKKIVVE